MINKNIKIAHIIEGFLGGTSTYLCSVLPQLVNQGFDVTLIVSINRSDKDAHEKISALKASGVKVNIIPMYREISIIRDTSSFIILLRLLSRNKYDIIHTHCSKAGVLGRVAGMLTGSRLRLHTPHCFAFTRCGGKYKNSLYFNIEKLFGKLTTRLIAVSYSEADIAVNSQIIPAHKCIVIENGLSEELTSCNELKAGNGSISKASLGINNETKIVATICRLIDYKGITRFLEAATYSNTPDTMFLIVGDGEFRNQAEKYIKEYSLENKVRLLGHITEIEELYAISNIVTLCSDSEAQPYVLLEAMKAKRPIVATSVSGNSDLVKNNNTGVLVEPESKKIAVAIDELLSDEQKCNRYTENAYEYFHKYHTLEKQISKLTETYLSLISENNNGSK